MPFQLTEFLEPLQVAQYLEMGRHAPAQGVQRVAALQMRMQRLVLQPYPSHLVQRSTSALRIRDRRRLAAEGARRAAMQALMAAARATGISEMCGEVLAGNHKMLQLTARFGFRARFDEAIRA